MLKLSITTNTTPKWSLEEDVRGLQAAGVQGIGVWWHKLNDYGLERGVELLKRSGLTVTSLNYAGVFALQDRSVQRALIPDAQTAIELAVRLGAATLSVMPGGRFQLSRPAAIEAVREGLAQMAPLAERYGVRLALEPHHPMYADTVAVVTTLPEALEIVRAAGSPAAGILLDVYHVWWSARVFEEIEAASGKIYNVHIDDWRAPTRDLMRDRAIPGEGAMPLRELIAAIVGTGYDGWYEIEIQSQELWELDHQELIRRCVEAWERITAGL